ncbi:GNAT family N-acetyltransferase [Thalassolituus sp.]|jgi:GNAT superfamily N-acetyltransferase|uniref:GNAT family N-acetyltransferase n=1 Tax=Thalassolituus sp. TaxID=2030822 RepID=UPI002A7EEF89|nr:GNAT family N-acetyltransferase [Thalassolituus sp.]|tara:strand:+ start:519 stop:833 length:315 start_codon:yes stop_codon:yes gene_type:complete
MLLGLASIAGANKLYKAAACSGRAAPSDLLPGVYLEAELVSVARIQINPEYGLIRHVCTLPLLRKQGYGTHVISHAIDLWASHHANIPLYLLQLPHLNDWYQRG